MTDLVSVTVDGDVARVTLDNPGMRNALTADLAEDLVAAMETVTERDVGCVVLAGNGETFCAGGDVDAMTEAIQHREAGEWDAAAVRSAVERTASAVTAVATCEIPTVAALRNPAYGAGAALAIACDAVVASEEAAINFDFRRLGLAVDSGVSYFLPRLVGASTAKTLVFTGETVEAERAADLGLFNRVVPAGSFEEELDAFVDRIASGPTGALRASKRLLDAGHRRSLDAAVEAETDAQVSLLDTEDHAEGVRAFFEGRDPEFGGS